MKINHKIIYNKYLLFCVLFVILVMGYIIQDYSYWLKRSPRDIKVAIRKNKELVNSRIDAVGHYYDYHGFVPESLEKMVNDPVGRQSWIQVTNNPWGHPIGYSVSKSTTNTIVKIWSYGCDNKLGGDGAAADVIIEWKQPNQTKTDEN